MISARVMKAMLYDEGRDDVRAFAFSAKREPILEALAKVVEAAEEHIECEPGMYANECVGLGGADGLQTALSELELALKECGV